MSDTESKPRNFWSKETIRRALDRLFLVMSFAFVFAGIDYFGVIAWFNQSFGPQWLVPIGLTIYVLGGTLADKVTGLVK